MSKKYITDVIKIDGQLLDGNGSAGTSGQVLSSTGTATDWVSLSEISGVDGSGTANYLAKWADGDSITNSIIYDNGTNVGIGTAIPSAKLDVAGNVSGTNKLLIQNSNNGSNSYAALGFQSDFGHTYTPGILLNSSTNPAYGGVDSLNIWQFHSKPISLVTSNIVRMIVTGGGNVGIGTTSPGAKLDIVGGGTSISPTLELNSSTSSTFNHAINAFNSNLTTGENQIIVVGKEGSVKNSGYIGYKWIGDGSNDNLVTIGHWASDNLVNIDALGNVGIGTTNPFGKLCVQVATDQSISLNQTGGEATIEALNDARTLNIPLRFYANKYSLIGGNVGIGTTSPNTPLEVHGEDIATTSTTTSTSVLRLVRDVVDPSYPLRKNSAVDFMLSRQQAVNNNLPYTRLDIRLAGVTDSSTPSLDVMSLLYNGNVGIGTTNPESKLHLYESSAAPTLLTLHNYQSDINPNGTQGNFIDFKMTDDNATFTPQVRIGMIVKDTDGDGGIPSEGTGNFVVYTAEGTDSSGNGVLTEHFRITDKGFVGIGTTTPQRALEVNHGAQGVARFISTSTTNAFIDIKDANTTADNKVRFGAVGDELTLFSGGAERMRIASLGNVGIGTTDPLDKLSVEGSSSNLLKIRNTTNAGGASIEFNDNGSSEASQNGTITYYHSDAVSQGGGASFWFEAEPDTVLVVGNSTNKGRIAVSSQNSSAEVDYGFRADTDTGVYSPTTDQVGLVAGGSRKLLVSGDGVTIENGRLYLGGTVDTNTSSTTALVLNGTEVEKRTLGSAAFSNTGDFAAASHTHDDRYYTETEIGNFFSGTTAITGYSKTNWDAAYTYSQVGHLPLTGGTISGALVIDSTLTIASATSAASYLYLLSSPTGESELRMGDTDTDAGSIAYNNNTDTMVFRTGAANRVYINSDGDVGIGVTNPGTKLHVGTGSGATVDTGYQAVIDSAGIAGLQILSATNQSGRIVFGDSDDNDVGMIKYDHTDNSMGFRTNGSGNERMRISSSGNVGIGTTNPETKLHIASGDVLISNGQYYGVESTTGGNYKIAGLTTGNQIVIGAIDYTSAATIFAGGDNIRFTTGGVAGSSRMYINSSGNVGIGTTSPTAKLVVRGADSAADFADYGIAVFENQQGEGLSIGYDTGDNYSYLYSREVGVSSRGLRLNGSIFVANVNGNVGIGTTSPSAKLHVSTNIVTKFFGTNSDFVSGSAGSGILMATGASTGNTYSQIYGFQAGNTQYANLVIPGGNVGIGTTSPGSELEVDGEITTTTITYPEPGALDSSAYNGEIVYFGAFESGIIGAGTLMSLGNDGGANMRWYKADDNQIQRATGLLGISLGTSASAGLLVRGIAKNSAWSGFTAGDKLYLSPTDGSISNSITSDTNDYVRIVGYALGSSKIYFCPDNTYIQNA